MMSWEGLTLLHERFEQGVWRCLGSRTVDETDHRSHLHLRWWSAHLVHNHDHRSNNVERNDLRDEVHILNRLENVKSFVERHEGCWWLAWVGGSVDQMICFFKQIKHHGHSFSFFENQFFEICKKKKQHQTSPPPKKKRMKWRTDALDFCKNPKGGPKLIIESTSPPLSGAVIKPSINPKPGKTLVRNGLTWIQIKKIKVKIKEWDMTPFPSLSIPWSYSEKSRLKEETEGGVIKKGWLFLFWNQIKVDKVGWLI